MIHTDLWQIEMQTINVLILAFRRCVPYDRPISMLVIPKRKCAKMSRFFCPVRF